nr:replication protein A 70 kDa DNA-binding subunit C-like [Tanacetum cinerariifolium]
MRLLGGIWTHILLFVMQRYVTNVGRIVQQRPGSRILDFYLANSRGQAVRVTLWGGLGEKLIEKRTCHVGLYPIVLTS